MVKVFFIATYPQLGTGYAKIGNKLTNWLADQEDFQVVYFGFQKGENNFISSRLINPKITMIDGNGEDPVSPNGFGDKAIIPNFVKEKPDILIVYNDILVCTSVLQIMEGHLHKTKIVLYMDLVFTWQNINIIGDLFQKIDGVIVFSEYWKQHLSQDMGMDSERIEVLPHGIGSSIYPMNSVVAKKSLGFEANDFLILNMNRNSWRKRWDTTIRGFIRFLKKNDLNPSIKLFCGCFLETPDGHNLRLVIQTECIRSGLDIDRVMNNHIFINPSPTTAPDEYVNTLYNASDVGLNSCCGEGFGLTAVEHGSLGKKQIVTGLPLLKEVLGEGNAIFIEPRVWYDTGNIEKHGGDAAICDPDDFCDALDKLYKNKDQCTDSRAGALLTQRYNWEPICQHFANVLRKFHNKPKRIRILNQQESQMSTTTTKVPIIEEGTSKKVIAVLTRGYEKKEKYASLISRNRSISLHLKDKSIKNLIFHQGDINSDHQSYIKNGTPDLDIDFIDISSKAFLNKYQSIPFEAQPLAYRHMCHFWLVDFWSFVVEYDSCLRIDEDCIIQFSVDEMFNSLEEHSLISGGTSIEDDQFTKGLNEFTKDYYAQAFIKHPSSGPFTNVLGMNLVLLRNPLISSYIQRVQESENIYKNGWKDFVIWGEIATYFLNDFIKNTKLRYYHGSEFKLIN